ncbi:RNA helicase [Mortierella alpina]|uniref:RNA helicase n=1 Tax=Mortierella alpina TaxID=64518 RepID=A0A9P6LZG4_MORAP|nr:RNA helicase [Mortierella alpina]
MPGMLSFAVARTPAASAAPSLLVARACSLSTTVVRTGLFRHGVISSSRNVAYRATGPTVISRFRHAAASARPSTPRSWDKGPSYNASSYGSERYGKAFGGKTFGGKEFTAQWETAALKNALERFKLPNGMQQHLETLGTPREQAAELVQSFSSRALRGEIPEVSKKAIGAMATRSLEPGMTFKSMGLTREEAITKKLDKELWDAFFTHCENEFPQETMFRLSRMREIADMRYPSEWYPTARLMKRKIIMHVGPTNSGKTYNALMRLQAAKSGAYLSPLRLLAHEVYERMNSAGTPCNLVTGEERRFGVFNVNGEPEPKSAKVVSCTIEMVDLNRKIDVAVVDEIQMLADPDRGWAWTHALLSLPAQEIHLCGEPTVVNLVKNICALTNEEVEVHRYDRLSKLEVQDESLYGGLDKIQKGDCVVTFSRKNIFLLKKAIEAETGLRCAVAYGSLPPESRSLQAKLFNDPKSGYDVLVASDAIGMGLNLNIRRIIFEAVEKFDGTVVRTLSLTQIKQIAGRAGRFGTEYSVGQATTLVQSDIPTLKRALAAPMTEIERAGIQPTAEMIEQFAAQLPGAPFSYVLKMFDLMSRNSDLFFPGLLRNMISAAEILDKIKMPIRERIPFISAPIQVRDPTVVEAAIKMARAVSNSKPLTIDEVVNLPAEGSKMETKLELRPLESAHRIIMLYLWLSQRFTNVIQGGVESEATKRKARCETLIEMALKQAENKRLQMQRERQEARDAREAKESTNVDADADEKEGLMDLEETAMTEGGSAARHGQRHRRRRSL